MDEEQQIIQEPVQEPAPEKQSDKTQAILTAVSPLVSVFFGGSAGINFRGDGGALVIRIPHPENALTRTREAEHVFDELLRRGAARRTPVRHAP